jgi:hypothetical protein
MKPIRLIVGVEDAATLGGMLNAVTPSALIDRMPRMKIQSRRSSIRSYYTDKSLEHFPTSSIPAPSALALTPIEAYIQVYGTINSSWSSAT